MSFRQIVETCRNFFLKIVVFLAISVQFPRDFVVSSKAINNKRMSYALIFLKRTLHRFASKTLQNDPKSVEKLQHICFCATFVPFTSIQSQNVGNLSTKIERKIQWAFKEVFADFGWKMAQNWRQNLKIVKIFADIWHFQWIFIWDQIILLRWKLRKALNDKTRSTARFSKIIGMFFGWKVPQNDPNNAKNSNFKFFKHF